MVWEIMYFTATQILREISFGTCQFKSLENFSHKGLAKLQKMQTQRL